MSAAARCAGTALLALGVACGDAAVPEPTAASERATSSSGTLAPPVLPTGAPGPAHAIAGLAGFHCRSRVTYAASSDAYDLDATYQFPERAVLLLVATDDPRRPRTIQYRFGSLAFQVDAHRTDSRELEPEARDRLLRRADLRLAAMVWPEAFAWSGAASTRTATLGAGSLEAEVAPHDGGLAPTRIVVRDADDRPQEVLVIEAWRECGGRRWPARMRFSYFDAQGLEVPVWTEALEPPTTRLGFLDAFFLPGDYAPRR